MIPPQSMGFSSVVCGVLLLMSVSSCARVDAIKVDITAKPQLDEKKSAAIEQSLGESGYYYLLLNYKVVNDNALMHRLRRLGTRLTYYCERPELEFKFIVIDTKYNHAFSLPDGYIVFTKGLIESLKSDELIQAVMAHELAHITARHGVYFYKEKYGAANSSVSGEKVVSLPSHLAYQRAFELQADLMGMRYMQRSGLNPEVFIQMLNMIEELQKKDEKVYESDQASLGEQKNNRRKDPLAKLTYPDTANRIVHCQQKLGNVRETEEVKYKASDFTTETK